MKLGAYLLAAMLVQLNYCGPTEDPLHQCQGEGGWHRGPFPGCCPGQCGTDETCSDNCRGIIPDVIDVTIEPGDWRGELLVTEPGPPVRLADLVWVGAHPAGVLRLSGRLDCPLEAHLAAAWLVRQARIRGEQGNVRAGWTLANAVTSLPELSFIVATSGDSYRVSVSTSPVNGWCAVERVTVDGVPLVGEVVLRARPGLRPGDMAAADEWLAGLSGNER